MKQLLLLLVLGTASFFAYDAYDKNQQQQREIQSSQQQYQQDKTAFEAARETGKLAPLEQFIRQHPDSAWLESAIYYRDKLVLQKAVDSRDTRRLERYIRNYPDSEWINHARQHLAKLEREQENARIQKRIQARTQEAKRNNSDVQPGNNASRLATSNTQRPALDSNERVKRALSIYQKMDKQKQREESALLEKRQREEKLRRECNRIRDQLKQFRGRTRWYRLDEQGKRVFIDKESVQQTKRGLEQDYNRHCQG